MYTLISELELKLIMKMSNKIFDMCNSNIINKDEISEIQQSLLSFTENTEDKFELCSTIETFYYIFSILLSEIRQEKREILTAIFEQKPKLIDEKSVLEKKLDAEPEYSKLKEKEEYLFQFLEHLSNVKNNINWLTREKSE